MSLDERMRAGVRAAASARSIDTVESWRRVKVKEQRIRTRRSVTLTAAAVAIVVAGVALGSDVLQSGAVRSDAPPAGQSCDEPRADPGTDDSTDEGGDEGGQSAIPPPWSEVEPGTYTYSRGPFPVTLTTTGTTFDPSGGGDPYRVVAGDLGDIHGRLTFDFPVNAADLSQPTTAEGPVYDTGSSNPGVPEYRMAGPVDFPSDVGAWLDAATSLTVLDCGTLSRPDGEAIWWDVEVSEPSARCYADDTFEQEGPPCVVLWPYLDGQDERQIGVEVTGAVRVYAVETGDDPLMAVAQAGDLETPGTSREDLARWVATANDIVSTITLE